ncbi:hypothetical protein [Rahnella woolbedingensis]|uniref:P68 RBP/TagC-like beta-propeller domain-containing protein n=1 Tax=Rahnella woolbedingensis TaxID=1510574 RepID=A0A419NDS1_9GAMM|nr:hypothetical protein [Rahnella woolbedingensis]RJT46760.1 hypothetical protein D6C13_02930 [Rahnella woolbedingensis]
MTYKKLFYLLVFFIGIAHAKITPPIKSECIEYTEPSSKLQCNHFNDHMTPTVLYRLGPGRNNVAQGIALESDKRILYSLHVTGNPEQGVLNRFIDIDGKGKLVAIDYQKPSSLIGHQGITIIPGSDFLLSSTGNGIKNKGWYISLFKYTPYDAPSSFSSIQVFDSSYSTTANTMPVVTPDSNHLLVRGRINNHNIIRVYDLTKINFLQSSDIRKKPSFEWQVDDEVTKDKYYFQAITADNNFVYILSGKAGKEHKRLYTYLLDGTLVSKADNVILGEKDAISSGKEGHWEPEGMAIDSRKKELYMLFAVGDKGKRLGNIYKLELHEH